MNQFTGDRGNNMPMSRTEQSHGLMHKATNSAAAAATYIHDMETEVTQHQQEMEVYHRQLTEERSATVNPHMQNVFKRVPGNKRSNIAPPMRAHQHYYPKLHQYPYDNFMDTMPESGLYQMNTTYDKFSQIASYAVMFKRSSFKRNMSPSRELDYPREDTAKKKPCLKHNIADADLLWPGMAMH